ncbi:MAG: BolA family protein [Nevskiales bacterium]
MSAERVKRIRTCLVGALAPDEIEVRDDSAAHAGHAGTLTGKGHFSVFIRSECFIDKSQIERHRMVYAALGNLMQNDIHALAIEARAPGE